MTDAMTQFRQEGQPAFNAENKENDNSAASSAGEQTNIDTTGSSDQNKNQTENKGVGTDENFASHPRWKERESDWTKRFNDQEVRHTSEIQKLREDFEQRFKSAPPQAASQTKVQVPSWFGGDEQQWTEFQEWNKSLVENAKKAALTEIDSKSKAEQQAIDEASKYMNDEIANLEADKELNPQGQSIDKNKLLKYVLDNELVDTKGRWNYKAAFKMMGADGVFKAKSALQDRKQLANATTSENRAETKPPAFKTSDDFKKPGERPW